MRSWLQILIALIDAWLKPSQQMNAPERARVEPAPDAVAYPVEMQELEARLLEMRGSPGPDVGVAVSGGGIRSATFALGVFQALARSKQLRHVDYLSTVSGGGYFGAFLGRLFTRPYVRSVEDVEWLLTPGEAGPAPRQELNEPRQNILRWLRENGRYLAPLGSGDVLLAGAGLLRNWLALQGVIATALLSIFLLLQLPRVVAAAPAVRGSITLATLQQWNQRLVEALPHGLWWSPWVFAPLLLAAIAFAVGWAYWIVTERSTPTRTLVWVVALAVEAVILWAGNLIAVLRVEPFIDQRPALLLLLLPVLAVATYFRPVDGAPASIGLSLLVLRVDHQNAIDRSVAWILLLVAALSILIGTSLWLYTRLSAPEVHQDTWMFRGQLARNLLTRYLRAWLVALGLAAAFVLVDSLGQTIYALAINGHLKSWAAGIAAAVTGVAAFGRRLVLMIHPEPTKRPSAPVSLLATVAALVLVGIIAIGFDLLSHSVAWNFGPVEAQTQPHETATLTHPVEATGQQQPQRQSPRLYALWLGGTLLLTLAFGRYFDFLNFSSQQTLYSSRLIRAYLGASNPSRWAKGIYYPVTEPLPDDDIEVHRYWAVPGTTDAADTPYERGAPLHLVNVTVNETFSGQSQVQQQDRKGVGMALGPAGVSAGVRHHIVYAADERPSSEDVAAARRTTRFRQLRVGHAPDHIRRLTVIYPKDSPTSPAFRMFDYSDGKRHPPSERPSEDAALASAIEFPGEPLSLGRWIGISGAAFSTGIGYRTSLGLSILTGLANIRLGYWWDSGIPSKAREARLKRRAGTADQVSRVLRGLLPVHTYLTYELGAHFPGTSRRYWYLSDGGHFENMAAYELIRRELPLIIVLDAEADPTYTFEGMANLVRKARVDFNATITFERNFELLTPLADSGFGPLESLRPIPVANDRSLEPQRSGAHAALARVVYASQRRGTLIHIKPTLTGDEPMDVLEYSRHHQPFPQQPTSDQFFDEAQWESYRALGEHIGTQLFDHAEALNPASWEERVWSLLQK